MLLVSGAADPTGPIGQGWGPTGAPRAPSLAEATHRHDTEEVPVVVRGSLMEVAHKDDPEDMLVEVGCSPML